MKRVALIGFGYWGPNLLRNLFDHPNCEVVYCSDLSDKKLDIVKKRYPSVEVTTSVEKVLQDSSLDGVVIATPTITHFSLAKQALLSGKDVLIEKPMVISSEQAEELVDLAEKKGKIIMVDHTFLFNNAVLKIKDLIDSGELGEILYIDSVRANLGLFQTDVNVIYDLASHDFSIIQFLIGLAPKTFQATGKSHYSHQEDLAYITIEYPQNIMAHVQVSWLSPLKVRSMFIVGSKKMIVYDDTKQAEKISVYDKGIVKDHSNTQLAEQMKIGYRTGDVWLPKIEIMEALTLMITSFIEAMESRIQPKSGGRFSLGIIRMLEAATQSVKTSKKVNF